MPLGAVHTITPCGGVLVLNEIPGLWIPGSLASLSPRNDGA
jgi:hypothetical protein